MRFEGRDLAALSGARAARGRGPRAQLIFQDPYGSLNPRMTVGEMLAEPLLLHTDLSPGGPPRARGRAAARRRPQGRARASAIRTSSPAASASASPSPARWPCEPKLIVCDEPVSALDVSIRSQILNLLKDLQQRLGLAYIFISHDLAVVKHIATRVAVMYLGRIVESAACDAIFAEPRHPYTQALLSAVPVPSARERRQRRILPGDPPSPLEPAARLPSASALRTCPRHLQALTA